MKRNDSVAGIAFAVPFVVAAAVVMAAQSVDVRQGYIPRPAGAEEANIAVPEDTIQIYKDRDFRDAGSTISGATANNKSGVALELPSGMEDDMTSARWNLPPGVVVVLYEDAGGKGEQYIVWGKGQIPTVSPWDFNDKASRWAWYFVGGVDNPPPQLRSAVSLGPLWTQATSGSVGADSMQLFRNKDFKGDMIPVSPVTGVKAGELQRLPGHIDNSMSSLRWNLPQGVVVILYQDAGGRKQQAAIWGNGELDNVDLWDFNDKVSRWAWFYVGSPAVSGSAAPTTPVSPAPAPSSPDVVAVDPIALVTSAMTMPNKLQVKSTDLVAKRNPTGDGTFVYVPRTSFDGVERHVIWIVVDGKPIAISGPAQMVTPSLPTPMDADPTMWSKTGLNKTHAEDDAVKIVFANH